MAKIKTTQLLLPAVWASALVNGDESGIEQEDSDAVRALLHDLVQKHGRAFAVDVSEDTQFCKYHDAISYGVLAADCALYTFDVGEES